MVTPNVPFGSVASSVWANNLGTLVDAIQGSTDATFLAAIRAALDSRYAPIALGRVTAPVAVITDQTGIAGVTDYVGFTITFNVVAGRFYEAQWHFVSSQVTATGTQTHSIVLDATGIIIGNVTLAAGAVNINAGAMQFSGGPASGNVPVVAPGSRTIKLRGLTSAGTMNLSNGGVMNGRFRIFDIGPNP